MTEKVRAALRDFVKIHPEVEGVLQRVGLATWDLVLVDVNGNWIRDVFSSEEIAGLACSELGIPMNRGWNPRLTRRMNERDHWNLPGGQRRAL
ncbi:MAG: hypothetical protein WD757_09520 [Actinomycetota bacterium]